jgi:cysteine synthase A
MQVILDAEGRGDLREGGTVVEGSSGSTGISLAIIARARGYKCRIFMPDDQSMEKTQLLRLLGAEVDRVPTAAFSNNKHYCNLAKNYASSHDNCFYADQFENESNFNVHYHETGPEIYSQTGGKIDAFVMSAGTGGTIAGVSSYLKEMKPAVKVFLADPPGSSFYGKVMHGVAFTSEQQERTLRRHRYDTVAEGVGLDRLTANFNRAVIDKAYRVTDKEMVEMSRYLLREEGLFVGSSSAMNVVAAVRAAREMEKGSTIVTVLCDSGSRHLSRFWNDDVMKAKGLVAEAGDLSFLS